MACSVRAGLNFLVVLRFMMGVDIVNNKIRNVSRFVVGEIIN